MYETLRRLYLEGRLSDTGLQNAVEKGWITTDERERILNAD